MYIYFYHKSSKDKDVIKFNSEESHIRMVIEKKDIPYKIDMHFLIISYVWKIQYHLTAE